MTTTFNRNNRKFFLLLPLAGFISFVILYIVAALHYPGGSNMNKFQKGFSVLNNYWCDLTGVIAKNGVVNGGQPYALSALIVLCCSTILLMFFLRYLVKSKSGNRKIVYSAGAIGILSLLFLPTSYHDTAITLGGLAGLIAFVAAFIGLSRAGYSRTVTFGVFCVVLLCFNYLIYETGYYMSVLPLLQKVTFIAFLSWLSTINILIYRQACRTAMENS